VIINHGESPVEPHNARANLISPGTGTTQQRKLVTKPVIFVPCEQRKTFSNVVPAV